MSTKKEIQTAKFNKLVSQYKQTVEIIPDDINIFFIHYDNNDILNNLPQNIEILIIGHLEDDTKINNLPNTLKKIILVHKEYEKCIVKIPFGCEIIVFDNNKHFNNYLSPIAFKMFITDIQKIKLLNIYSSFSDVNDRYFCKVSLSKVKGIWENNKICDGSEISLTTDINYIINHIKYYNVTL